MSRPPRGLTLLAPDGSSYSGLAVLDRSQVVVLIACRHEAGRQVQPAVTPAPVRRSYYDEPQRGFPDDPPWPGDGLGR